MARIERKHQVLSEPLTEQLLQLKASEGWRPVGVVWERTVEGVEPDTSTEAVPYGLRVASDCSSLEPDAGEIDAMVHMLRGVVEEKSLSSIADALNHAGYRTRLGTEWKQTAVFHMLPRLIEVAPTIYSSEAWQALKQHFEQHS